MRRAFVFLLLLGMSTSIANATSIDSISTDPNPPIYKDEGDFRIAFFTVTVHVVDPPVGGHLAYSIGGMDYYSGSTTIDNNGLASLSVNVQKGYYLFGHWGFQEPTVLYLRVFDANGNIVISEQQYIKCYDLAEIPEFPSVALPIVAILGLILIFERKKND